MELDNQDTNENILPLSQVICPPRCQAFLLDCFCRGIRLGNQDPCPIGTGMLHMHSQLVMLHSHRHASHRQMHFSGLFLHP